MSVNDKWLATVVCCSFLLSSSNGITPQTGNEGSPFTFRSNVDVVLVPVLVNDRNGHAVGNLRKEDFQVFDNNKRQVISAFMVASHRSTEKNRASASCISPLPRATTLSRFLIFLFDDMHSSIGDLVRTKEAAKKILGTPSDDTEMMAVVSLSGTVNSGLTLDRTKLQDAIMKLQPRSLYRNTETGCPEIDYYQAELIANEHSSEALEAATEEVLNCNPSLPSHEVAERLARSAAQQEFTVGEQDVQVSLASIRALVLRAAALPGQTTIVLVSPGFLGMTAQAKAEESRIIDTAAVSNVTINALDARGLYTVELDASDRGGSSTRTTQLKSEYHRASMPLSENIMAELAIGTGGTYFHNNNDLEGGLQRLTTTPEYLYLLEFHPTDVKHDGSYHHLKVKLDRGDLKVQSRRGYSISKSAKVVKEKHP